MAVPPLPPPGAPPVPTLYEWAGGMVVFERLTALFYQKVVADELLEPVFGRMSADHPQHVAHFLAEVFGGPPQYSTADGGSHHRMIQHHFGKYLTEAHRQRWVRLLLATADEIELPADPEFRSAFVAYLEWGTRIAILNSHQPTVTVAPDEPMPRWGWGVPGGPYLGG